MPITWLWLGGSALALMAGCKLLGVDHDLLEVLDVFLSEGHPRGQGHAPHLDPTPT